MNFVYNIPNDAFFDALKYFKQENVKNGQV